VSIINSLSRKPGRDKLVSEEPEQSALVKERRDEKGYKTQTRHNSVEEREREGSD
jgi:hypothetical protein